jgi:hypothetical protein
MYIQRISISLYYVNKRLVILFIIVIIIIIFFTVTLSHLVIKIIMGL